MSWIQTVKCYICYFICFTSKAIHLEPISDLTAEAFLAVLRRFTSRRGTPSHIYTDNGTYFVRANSDLKEFYEFLRSENSNITDVCAINNIQWHFSPPQSPHFGGLWEAGIKSCKFHLKRIMGNSNLTFENLLNLLVQIEGVLNSRPLCPLSNDSNDLEPLTPAHFLIGRSLQSVPDPDLLHIQENRLSTLQHMQQLKQHFWHRWSSEYIGELQRRQKWRTNQQNIQQGTLVLMRDDNLPPLQWKLGRVFELHTGPDGICRVVSVTTNKGTYKRAVARICPLPICDSTKIESGVDL